MVIAGESLYLSSESSVFEIPAGTESLILLNSFGGTDINALAVTTSGQLYASDNLPGNIYKYLSNNESWIQLGSKSLDGGYIISSCMYDSDLIYVSTSKGNIFKYSNGIWTNIFSNSELRLTNLRVDKYNNLYASYINVDTLSTYVIELKHNSSDWVTLSGAAIAGVRVPYSMAIDNSGNVFLGDAAGLNNFNNLNDPIVKGKVYKYSSENNTWQEFGSNYLGYYPMSLVTNSLGQLYAATVGFDATFSGGVYNIPTIGGVWQSSGLNSPTYSVAVDNQNNLYVATESIISGSIMIYKKANGSQVWEQQGSSFPASMINMEDYLINFFPIVTDNDKLYFDAGNVIYEYINGQWVNINIGNGSNIFTISSK